MQMAPINAKYAASIPEIKDKAAAAGSDVNAVLKLLTANPDYDFGSAAWYYSTQCSPDVKKGLQSGSADGWNAYITDCVQTTVDDKRKDYYNRAAKAFGLAGH